MSSLLEIGAFLDGRAFRGKQRKEAPMARQARHAMPDDVAAALTSAGVKSDYDARPAYQRNDYVGWIVRAKEDETRRKRIHQMTDELKRGGVYMGMKHGPSAKE